MEDEQESSLFGLGIDPESNDTLRTASQWGRFLSVLGFILALLVIILGVITYNKLTTSVQSYSGEYGRSLRTIATRNLILFVFFAGVLVTGAIFTLNFSNRVTTALDTSDQDLLNNGLSAFKTAIIFWAVIFVVFILLVLYTLMNMG